jgi:hypothetical protein
MKRVSKTVTIFLALLGGALLLTGCKASKCVGPDGGELDNCIQLQPLKRYNGTVVQQSVAWSAGKTVTIENHNGTIVVDAAGGATAVSVDAAPFDLETGDEAGRAAATSAMDNNPLAISGDTSGNVIVTGNGGTYVGFDLTVHVPSTFDGALSVTGHSGSVTVATAATSPSTVVSAGAGDIMVTNAFGHLEITGQASDITFAGAPKGIGNFIKTDVGKINATIVPTANLAITATCDNGTVTLASSMTNATMGANNASAAITLGTGLDGVLAVQSGMGDIIFH